MSSTMRSSFGTAGRRQPAMASFDEVDYDWFRTDIDAAVKDQKNKLELDEIQTPKEFSRKKGDNQESKDEE